MMRRQLPQTRKGTFVLPAWKTVYVSAPKAACTSVKWLLAEVQGQDPEWFYGTTSWQVSRSLTIHMRHLWRDTPMLHELSERELAEITTENGWFVFTVVRHPMARVFSAWQSKLLLREPLYVHNYGGEPWFPALPESTADVVESSRAFEHAIAARPEPRVLEDRHFQAQTRAVALDRMPYTRVYRTSELPLLLEELGRHLGAQGYGRPLALAAANETPLPPISPLFSPDVVSALTSVYAADFQALGYPEVLPALSGDDRYTTEALAEVRRLAERAERVGDLALIAQRLRAESQELRRRLASGQQRAGWLRQTAGAGARSITRSTSAWRQAARRRGGSLSGT